MIDARPVSLQLCRGVPSKLAPSRVLPAGAHAFMPRLRYRYLTPITASADVSTPSGPSAIGHRPLNVDAGARRKEGVRAYLGRFAKVYLDLRFGVACVTGVCSVFLLRFRIPPNAVSSDCRPSEGGEGWPMRFAVLVDHAWHGQAQAVLFDTSVLALAQPGFFFVLFVFSLGQFQVPNWSLVTGHAWHRFDSDGGQ